MCLDTLLAYLALFRPDLTSDRNSWSSHDIMGFFLISLHAPLINYLPFLSHGLNLLAIRLNLLLTFTFLYSPLQQECADE